MTVSELIDLLRDAQEEFGDVECLIEVVSDDMVHLMPADEVSFEDREGYGASLAILQ